MHIANIAPGCTNEEALFVSLDDLDYTSISLEVNNLEEEIIHLFNEAYLFSSLKKNTTNQALNILRTCTVIRGK